MKIQKEISLRSYTTFGVEARTPYLVEVETLGELKEALQKKISYFILGGGSNVLFVNDLDVPVLRLAMKGIQVLKEEDDFVWVEVQAGENWHQFVLYALNQGWGGMENLSLIPGSVGATPVQNIGAYGVEVKSLITACKVLNMETLEQEIWDNEFCQFGYRDSIFKKAARGKYVITSVIYRLTRRNHRLQLHYGGLQQQLASMEDSEITPAKVSQAIISIRKQKLPDPQILGNCGSFFKNPIVSRVHLADILKRYPQMPFYEVNQTEVKIPAGWLIEQCGMKGFRQGDAGVHSRQALVLVNYGEATGKQIQELSERVRSEVKKNFQIDLEVEVNII